MLRRLLGIIAVSACAQTPYELARAIDSHDAGWASIWKAVGIKDMPSLPRCSPDTTEPCSVDVITLLRPSPAILVLSGWPEARYLRFVEDGSRWRFAGTHLTFFKNYAERYEITRFGETPFLRISGQGANGSDIDSEMETWFDLTLSDFAPVFQFTVQGSENRMGIGVSRKVRAYAFDGGEGAIGLGLEGRYSSAFGTNLGFAKYRGTYQRAANQEKFLLRSVTPAISNKDFEALANIDFREDPLPSNEQLIVYTLPRLKQIASGTNEQDRGWLRSVLGFCKDTPEKRILLQLLRSPH